jgi:death-on-curing protein
VTPLFLSLERVLRIHRSMIEQYGGEEGIRDAGLLHFAIAVPQASFGGEYLHADLFEMAAAYLYHIVQNHPFIDGNIRTMTGYSIRPCTHSTHREARATAS